MKPDMSLGNPMQDKAFFGGKGFQSSGRASVRDFSFIQKFSPTGFLTKDFLGSKNFWAGDFQIAAKPENAETHLVVPFVSKGYDTKTMETRDAREGSKLYGTRTYETHAADNQAKSQKALSQQNPEKPPMTIDQVRDLLNKNK